jgi:hypothetical protein
MLQRVFQVWVATAIYLNETSETKICYFNNIAISNKHVAGS